MSLVPSPQQASSTGAVGVTPYLGEDFSEAPCPDCDDLAPGRPGLLHAWCREAGVQALRHIRYGGLVFRDRDAVFGVGDARDDAPVITVHRPRVWRRLVFGGPLAVAESYFQRDWDCDDLAQAMKVLARNAAILQRLEGGWSRLRRPLRRAAGWLRRNTLAGSRRNIAAHYDLSNEFFALMLDETMCYSAGIFATPESSLADASREKLDRICRRLALSPADHLLEIGCGWGSLAIHAAKHYGCRVTVTTISQRQYEFAKAAIEREGLSDRITMLRKDYRQLQGKFDKLASIEMVEAVGEQYLDRYFQQCSRLLKEDGLMLLQAITMPEARYERYRRSVDFIQQYVFPGGFLPSVSAIGQALRRGTDLEMQRLDDIAPHYAETLRRWRGRFWQNIERVRQLGFDERFIRIWHYYLCYCEAAFDERMTGVAQILLAKPQFRPAR